MATKIEVIPVKAEHLAALSRNMRDADRRELWASSRKLPEDALKQSLAFSTHVWAGLADDETACIFGVGPATLISGTGVPWMLGTDLLERHPMAFLRRCRHYVADMLVDYDRLMNMVDSRNEVSVRWLQWLGFTIYQPVPFGPDGVPFHPFELRR